MEAASIFTELEELADKQKKQELRYVWHRFSTLVPLFQYVCNIADADSLVPCLKAVAERLPVRKGKCKQYTQA